MDVIRDAPEFQRLTDSWRADGATVGLVPTMGALHEGHLSLIRKARGECRSVAVSTFVNPLQFGAGEDFESYPRDRERDLAICEREGVDAVWAPGVGDMYPPGVELPSPDPGPVGDTFEGTARPGHFAGVLKAVHRLLSVTGPCRTYFGEKDAQQLFLIRQMVNQADRSAEIVACPTVREPDGLAMSSRNAYLSPEERSQAACLFLALTEAAQRARSGESDANVLVAVMAREIGATPSVSLDYAAVVDEVTFQPLRTLDRPARSIVAARFPSARLIDNLLLPEPA